MKKKSIGVKSRQRQKMTRRTIIILAASCFLLIGGGLTLFFNLTQVDNTRAKDSQTINVIMVPDFKPVNEKELAAPFVDPKLNNNTNPNALFIRKAKPLQANAQTYLQ